MSRLQQTLLRLHRAIHSTSTLTREQVAEEMEKAGQDLMEVAKLLRQNAQQGIGSRGGVSDRVLVQVFGPDGEPKHPVSQESSP